MQPLPQVVVMQKGVKNLHFRPISHYISEILQARALVTTEDEWELVCALLNVAMFCDLE